MDLFAIIIIVLVLFTLALCFVWKPPLRPLPSPPAIEIHDPQNDSFAKTKGGWGRRRGGGGEEEGRWWMLTLFLCVRSSQDDSIATI